VLPPKQPQHRGHKHSHTRTADAGRDKAGRFACEPRPLALPISVAHSARVVALCLGACQTDQGQDPADEGQGDERPSCLLDLPSDGRHVGVGVCWCCRAEATRGETKLVYVMSCLPSLPLSCGDVFPPKTSMRHSPRFLRRGVRKKQRVTRDEQLHSFYYCMCSPQTLPIAFRHFDLAGDQIVLVLLLCVLAHAPRTAKVTLSILWVRAERHHKLPA
jgi:hypothetical protein